ncbi:CaiB/BaiF CoA transferase family protein [Alteromonas sp. a30]|uniref:CaiB/BaiF CoA transferase family protein n=1 Tax=Alteromonas sp. a30 TaxID=2730917 RepID=UPI002280BFC0|nr:CoA transferase [Alteromonas sp. a30]MCY7295294.1 CoA transferase [Alteromonas sp. a30]
MTNKALQGVRVLDLSRVLAGPYCTQMLGDLGADIIKVERPNLGDDTRRWGPPFLQSDDHQNTAESAYYLSANRNKQSIAIDMTTKAGQALIHQLLAESDVLVHNFKVDGLAKFGLEYEQLKSRYPKLVYCAISGFGQTGPMRKEPGYDFLAQAMSGLMACTGEPEAEPMKVGVALVDVMTGLNAVAGILAALHARHATGKGQMVDLSLLDCGVASLTNIAQYYLTSGKTAPRQGNAHPSIVPYQTFATADGYIILAVGNDTQFARLAHTLERPEWSTDPNFASNAERVNNRDTLCPLIADILQLHSTDYWLEKLKNNTIPCAPVNKMNDVFESEQVIERQMQVSMAHPLTSKPISLVGSPLKLSDTPVSYDLPPPYCGQHTDSILKATLNLSDEEIAQLRAKGVIQ